MSLFISQVLVLGIILSIWDANPIKKCRLVYKDILKVLLKVVQGNGILFISTICLNLFFDMVSGSALEIAFLFHSSEKPHGQVVSQ